MPKYELAVVESRWERKKNYSIRSIFDLISDLSYGDTHGYHYEMVNDERALREIVSRQRQTRGIRALYIAGAFGFAMSSRSSAHPSGYGAATSAHQPFPDSKYPSASVLDAIFPG